MINVLMVCHGNICRSPMAEFMLKDMVEKRYIAHEFYIESAATSRDQVWEGGGSPVHPGTRKRLAKEGISVDGKFARQMTKSDYDRFDYILAMEDYNVRNIMRIIGSDPDGKVKKLLDFSSNPRDIADPWYTGNFDVTYDDILEGLEAFLEHLKNL